MHGKAAPCGAAFRIQYAGNWEALLESLETGAVDGGEDLFLAGLAGVKFDHCLAAFVADILLLDAFDFGESLADFTGAAAAVHAFDADFDSFGTDGESGFLDGGHEVLVFDLGGVVGDLDVFLLGAGGSFTDTGYGGKGLGDLVLTGSAAHVFYFILDFRELGLFVGAAGLFGAFGAAGLRCIGAGGLLVGAEAGGSED